MKQKLLRSPLFITSMLLLLYALYLIANVERNLQSWGVLIGTVLAIYAGIGIVIAVILQLVLRRQSYRLMVELLLIIACLLWLVMRQ